MKHYIGTTRNGLSVYVELVLSNVATQIAQQPHLLQLAKALLAVSDVSGKRIWLEGDMGHQIGVCDIIETSSKDVIFYAKRARSDVFARFVKNRPLEPTSFLSLELLRVDPRSYQLIQVIFGHPLPALPGEGDQNETALEYWLNHAFLWGDWPVNSRTITKDCPW